MKETLVYKRDKQVVDLVCHFAECPVWVRRDKGEQEEEMMHF